jgi:hypothetical protein
MLFRLCLLTLLATVCSTAIAQQKGNPALPCYHALAGDPRFAPIRDKVALGGSVDELRRMTAGGGRASQPEGAALAAWRTARETCHQQELPYYATRDLEIQALAREHFAAVQALIAELQAGALTYGEFGKRRLALYEKVNRDIDRVRQDILPSKPIRQTIDKK